MTFLLLYFIMHSTPDMSAKALCFRIVCNIHPFVCSSGQILLPQYFMNALINLEETFMEYSLSSTDDVVRFWRSKVKVTPSHRGDP